ncbi:MAG TPA: phosphosulfolactate synthase [Peptococcaceae bacterium]|nr:MAG: Phosphosulfolactate synthase [Moorella sp. 60_41]HBT46482.1 phosphosulfolactate synthase [Peptococcaceae bacterium]
MLRDKGDYGGGGWQEILEFPLQGRLQKPRRQGLTMVIDKGMGLAQVQDLLLVAAPYIDFIKLGFGTSVFYPADLLREKIGLVRSYGVDIFPGGTFLEVAVLQGKLELYLKTAREMGYTFVEVSDGTITMEPEVRRRAIHRALELGMGVICEVGKKDPGDRVEETAILEQIRRDLEDGAYKVIVEGRESGKGVVIYDDAGAIKWEELEAMAAGIERLEDIIWEAPLKQQQQELILRFGPNVNLGNVHPQDVLALEALRVGLRGDTLRAALRAAIS